MSLQAALERHRAGDLQGAEAAYRGLLVIDPNAGNAWNLLGVLLHQTARSADAADALCQAIRCLPEFADAHSNRAMVALDRAELDLALSSAERALALQPAHPSARLLKFRALCARATAAFSRGAAGDLEQARQDFARALELAPSDAAIHLDLANVLRRQGRAAEALTCYAAAVRLAGDAPGRARALVAQATTWREEGQWMAALDAFLEASVLAPEMADAWQGAAVVQLEIGHADAAQASFRQALSLAPDNAGFHSAALGGLNYCSGVSAESLRLAHQRWGQRHAPRTAAATDMGPDPAAVRLRVGLLSADLRAHPVACFVAGWLPHMAALGCEIIVYSDARREDSTSQALAAKVTRWRPVAELPDGALAECIAADRLDLLLELSGHSAPNRLRALARKPARQIWSWIGYPAGSGLQQIDARVTDAVADPELAPAPPSGSSPETARVAPALPPEPLIRLPGCFLCYAPPPAAQEILPESESLPGAEFVFASFNNIAKLNDRVIGLWADILRGVPGSRLRLKSHALGDVAVAQSIADRFAQAGVAPERLDLLGFTAGLAAHFSSYDGVDLALDPFPYNGTTTSCEALWMGVPVLTLAGELHAGRVSSSLLTAALGDAADDWIAADEAAYLQRAMAAAAHGKRSRDERMALRRRVEASPLLDGAAFAKRLTDLMRSRLARSSDPGTINRKT